MKRSAFIGILGACVGNDVVERAVKAVTCGCGGKCECHHPNPAVEFRVKQVGDCICPEEIPAEATNG